jgi:uncharacterized membrane protein
MIVEHTIQIEAPPEMVWRVTTDVERWPEWTPTVTSVKRLTGDPFGPGSVARIKQPAQPEADWVVTIFEPGRRFAWQCRRTGMRMIGSHELSAEGAGTTNVLRVEAGGWVAALLWPALRLAVRRSLREENQGLKRYCEEAAHRRDQPAE